MALVVIDLRLGSRLALITAGSAAASLTTRLPRALTITAALGLVVAAIAVLGVPGGAHVTHAHAGIGHRHTHVSRRS